MNLNLLTPTAPSFNELFEAMALNDEVALLNEQLIEHRIKYGKDRAYEGKVFVYRAKKSTAERMTALLLKQFAEPKRRYVEPTQLKQAA